MTSLLPFSQNPWLMDILNLTLFLTVSGLLKMMKAFDHGSGGAHKCKKTAFESFSTTFWRSMMNKDVKSDHSSTFTLPKKNSWERDLPNVGSWERDLPYGGRARVLRWALHPFSFHLSQIPSNFHFSPIFSSFFSFPSFYPLPNKGLEPTEVHKCPYNSMKSYTVF